MRRIFVCVGLCACAGTAARPMQLRRVVLYQNGIGYFERSGHVTGETLKLTFAKPELDDVLKTLTVIDRLGAGVATVDVPTPSDGDRTIGLGVRMSEGRVHDVQVSYAVPTPTWKAAYRVVLDTSSQGLLQGWAMVNNTSQEDWAGVALTLATGAPMSFVADLHTPQYVSRPDATGRLIAPTVLGPVDSEKLGVHDSDGDGLADVVDRCPDAPEDRDAFDDDDGCPDVDGDRDRIPDSDDKCPNEPETYNGYEDTDGCPDRGRVVVTDTAIEILDRVYFTKNGDVLMPQSGPILSAIAQTLQGNPEIRKVEISGHASDDEDDIWGVAMRRANNVRAALVDRGVASNRLAVVPFGASRPVDAGTNELARSKNRRVEFLIAERGESLRGTPTKPAVMSVAAVQQSVRTSSKPVDVAGSVRYELSEPVTIRKGASSMVSILNKPVGAEDAFLYRPDANAPGSDRHPFRAVRLSNDSGFSLEAGPVAIFSKGTFVGDTLLGRLDAGETAWIPYALDGGTTVTATSDDTERAVRIASIQRGVITVENSGTHTTRYTIAAGRDPAKQIFIRHAKALGYTASGLPPTTQDQGIAYLVPLPLHAGKTSTLVIEERQPRRRTIQLLDAGATELGLYIEGSKLPPGVAEKLAQAIALRKDLGTHEEETVAIRERIGDLATRAEEVRENLRTIDKVRGADDLRKRLVGTLTQATTEADTLARQLGAKMEAIAAARSRLQDSLREITLEPQ